MHNEIAVLHRPRGIVVGDRVYVTCAKQSNLVLVALFVNLTLQCDKCSESRHSSALHPLAVINWSWNIK